MSEYATIFKAIRQSLYDGFQSRADAIFNLLDSLSGNQKAQSVVELSLESPFDRGYNSLYDAVQFFFVGSSPDKAVEERREKALDRVKCLLPAIPKPVQRPFWLTGTDATPALRPYANTLPDRGVVYYPNPAPGNNPIGVGHNYSIVALLPEPGIRTPPWVVPLSCERIATEMTANDVAVAQMTALLNDPDLPFGDELTVNVADSGYSNPSCHLGWGD